MNKRESEIAVIIGAVMLLASTLINVVLWAIPPFSMLLAAVGFTIGLTGLMYMKKEVENQKWFDAKLP